MRLPQYPQLSDRGRLHEIARLGLDREEHRPYLTEVVDEVAERLGTPFAVLDVLLDDAQVFLAGHGPMPPWIAEVGGTPIEWAFCTPMLEHRESHVVDDFTTEPGYCTNPLVTVEGVRSYIGAPLISSAGFVLGGLCAIDVRRRDFDDRDRRYLTDMAVRTVRRIEDRAEPAS
ncbi:GAF domain-containing protein [Actinoplanes sp. NPDC020271]|uniref:GAF domain-containing protein n=1 Tax=Actinoplanes sp. NPDC020271 TaxID=3363896 RepID=UPI0037A9A90A